MPSKRQQTLTTLAHDLNDVMGAVYRLRSDIRQLKRDPADIDNFVDLDGLAAYIEAEYDPIGRKFARPTN
jgi:hypothetical protein